MSAELELGMRVDALIVKFLEEEGTTIGCSRWIRKNLDLGELKVLAEQAISERIHALCDLPTRWAPMTSPALAKLLGPKPTEPQPMEWIKVRRHAPYVRLVVPACEVCGDSAGEVTWYHAKTGRARCMRCFGRVP